MEHKIVFATSNEGKMKEIRLIMEDSGYEVVSLKEAGISADIEENGTTFEENAVIKASAIAKLTGELAVGEGNGSTVFVMPYTCYSTNLFCTI